MLAKVQRRAISYCTHSVDWFNAIRHLPHAIWLDSGRPESTYGRFDILSASPAITLKTRANTTVIARGDGVEHSSKENPFRLLREQLITTAPLDEVPFTGGALGYFAYDLGRRLEKIPEIAVPDIALPDMFVGIYPWAIIQDHQDKIAWLVTNEALSASYDFTEIEKIIRLHGLMQKPAANCFSFTINKFKPNLNVQEYANAIFKIQSYINAGDCYQVNFAQRFSAQYSGDSFAAYLSLRRALPSPFSAFMQLDQGAILSLSPERFIKVDGRSVETKPIKGTIARGLTQEEDLANAIALKSSLKDRAENLMIVDLLRNDLSKTCSDVKVTELFALQSFANVHHLVSTITAKLKPNRNSIDVLANSFPGGSITGAPKIRAMEIIEELEPTRRSLYCGSIGYISSCGNMDTNIAIRTLVCDAHEIHCWGGGGIVTDSVTEKEYQESLAKVNVLMDTLEQHFRKAL